MEFVIAKLIQTPRYDGKYDKSNIQHGRVLKPNRSIEKNYLEDFNANFGINGQYYVVDEEATKEFNVKLQDSKDERKRKEAAKQLLGSDLINAIVNKGLDSIVKEEKPKEEEKPKRGRKAKEEGGDDAIN